MEIIYKDVIIHLNQDSFMTHQLVNSTKRNLHQQVVKDVEVKTSKWFRMI